MIFTLLMLLTPSLQADSLPPFHVVFQEVKYGQGSPKGYHKTSTGYFINDHEQWPIKLINLIGAYEALFHVNLGVFSKAGIYREFIVHTQNGTILKYYIPDMGQWLGYPGYVSPTEQQSILVQALSQVTSGAEIPLVIPHIGAILKGVQFDGMSVELSGGFFTYRLYLNFHDTRSDGGKKSSRTERISFSNSANIGKLIFEAYRNWEFVFGSSSEELLGQIQELREQMGHVMSLFLEDAGGSSAINSPRVAYLEKLDNKLEQLEKSWLRRLIFRNKCIKTFASIQKEFDEFIEAHYTKRLPESTSHTLNYLSGGDDLTSESLIQILGFHLYHKNFDFVLGLESDDPKTLTLKFGKITQVVARSSVTGIGVKSISAVLTIKDKKTDDQAVEIPIAAEFSSSTDNLSPHETITDWRIPFLAAYNSTLNRLTQSHLPSAPCRQLLKD